MLRLSQCQQRPSIECMQSQKAELGLLFADQNMVPLDEYDECEDDKSYALSEQSNEEEDENNGYDLYIPSEQPEDDDDDQLDPGSNPDDDECNPDVDNHPGIESSENDASEDNEVS